MRIIEIWFDANYIYGKDETGDSDNSSDDDNDDNSSGSSSGGQSSGLSAGSAGAEKVKLGKAKLACVTGDAGGEGGGQDGALYSLNRNGLKIMYYETLGLISVVGGSQDQLDTIAAYIASNK